MGVNCQNQACIVKLRNQAYVSVSTTRAPHDGKDHI